MNPTEKWFKSLDSIAEVLDQTLVTEEEFIYVLQQNIIDHPHSPIKALQFQINCADPFESKLIGIPSVEDETETYMVDALDKFGASCRIKVWQKNGASLVTTLGARSLRDYLTKLIISYWKPDLRDENSRLISTHVPGTKTLIENSIKTWAEKDAVFALYCDLDKFKQVNDTFDEATGNRVILEFAAIVYAACSRMAVPIHNGGDEFLVLNPTSNPDQTLHLARKIMTSVSEYDFKVTPVEVGISSGIVRIVEAETYESFETRGHKVLKPDKDTKHRGRATMEKFAEVDIPQASQTALETALCVIKSGVDSLRPFESPWLNIISQNACELFSKRIENQSESKIDLTELIGWIQPEINNTLIRAAITSDSDGDNVPVFSVFDILLASAHGIFRAAFVTGKILPENASVKIIYNDTSKELELRLQPDGEILINLACEEIPVKEIDLGGFIYKDIGTEEETEYLCTQRASLVAIGHRETGIPDAFFIDKIVVDDRPTRGGGLPDFWEATIAKLITQANRNANLEAVFVLGDHRQAALTVKKLTEIGSWEADIERMSYKTGMSHRSILTAVDRLKNKIYLPEGKEELITQLSKVLSETSTVKAKNTNTSIKNEDRFLRRETDLGDMALDKHDGCIVKTVAEAFPVILDIAKESKKDEKIVTDQAGEQFVELIDFKVVLKEPLKSIVPAFYRDEERSLNDYFEKQFISDEGLFGNAFQSTGQLEAVMQHLTEAASNTKHQFTTRRAVLVVPNTIKPEEEFAPLGLISVRIIPRFSKNKIVLSYSYTWRTVEVLVGFPYSIYGSVRYAAYLTEILRARLPEPLKGNLEMGEVSYIAHSLHIFLDEQRQNIARTIVDNASF